MRRFSSADTRGQYRSVTYQSSSDGQWSIPKSFTATACAAMHNTALGLRGSIRRARRGAGLREFSLRDLRHFMATHMLDAGVPHRRVSTTLDRYSHVVPGRDALAAETLWQIVQDGD